MDPPESSSSSGPVRPTRQPKESTALLMSVVRSISASESNDHRDKEKAKLDKEFKKSDSRLDELIASNHIELSDVIQAFGKVSSRLAASREKIKQIKESLANCRMLLNCRRDELKRLWLEGIEHKQVLYLLEQIDNLKGVPETIEKYKQKKQYLNATTLLVSSVETLEGSLEGVDAMKDVQNELQFKQQPDANELEAQAIDPNTKECEPDKKGGEPDTKWCEPDTKGCEPDTKGCEPDVEGCESGTKECEDTHETQ